MPAEFSSLPILDPAHSSVPAAEFGFQASDFERVRDLLYRRAGIRLHDDRQHMAYTRLIRRVRVVGCSSFKDYLDQLQNPAALEWEHFINALTTNLTSFYREPHHFELLKSFFQARAETARQRPIHIWCCAAATGEEPYTIAFTALEAFGAPDTPVRILATDIDTHVLEIAQQGMYTDEQVKRIDPDRVARYFVHAAERPGQHQVCEAARQLVGFRPLNLRADEWSIRGGFDLVFCRNVLIYFDLETQTRLLQRVAQLLNPGGLLFVGHAEKLSKLAVPFRLLDKTVYEVLPQPGRDAVGR